MILLSRFLQKHALLVLLISCVLSAFGIFYSGKLYLNLKTDLEELLPTTARSVLDLGEVGARLESIDNLSVVVLSENGAASKRFVQDFERELLKLPKDVVASVETNIQKELSFFMKRRALYLETQELVRIRDYVKAKIDYETTLYNPLVIFAEINIPEPTLDLQAMKSKYDSKLSTYANFPDGYYATPNEKVRIVLVYLPSKSTGGGDIHKMKRAVEEIIARLDPKKYAPDLDIKYAGGVQNTIEEQAALVADLELSTVIVMIIVTIAMWVFFRAIRASFALIVALLMGTFWTFGISYFAIGYLNANSAFLGSIVLGNGINFPIILLARYLEERRANQSHSDALDISMQQTAIATLTAALAAGLAYGSLALTGFRGFRQFGIIGLIGMVFCWISAYTVMPALLTIFDRRRSLKPTQAPPRAWIAGSIAYLVKNHARPIAIASLVLTAIAAFSVTRYNKTIIETDLSKLRNKESMENGSGYYSKYVDEVFQRYLSPMVILPHNREDALKIAAILKKKKEQEGDQSLIASVQTIDEFVPTKQSEKIAILGEIQRLLPESILKELPESERALARELVGPNARQPFTMNDLPQLVRGKFTERNGAIGNLVVVEPPLGNVSEDGDKLIAFVKDLRDTADSVSPGAPVAGTLPISSDMIESIVRDGPKATLFAFIAVVALVIVLFRSPGIFFPIIFGLIMGVGWLIGFILIFWYKVNFLNFIALPITFGIGVDYAVNVFSRFREEGPDSLIKVLKDTGGAVMLCSFTTGIGYGSLLIAQNQAFVSFGVLAVVGEITCLVAAMFSLPSLLLFFRPAHKR